MASGKTPDCCRQVSYHEAGRAGPVELATGVKVMAPSNKGFVGPRKVSPGAFAEAPIG